MLVPCMMSSGRLRDVQLTVCLSLSDATTGIAISSNIEAGLGITAGSLIMLRPLIRWLRCIGHSVSDKVRGVTCGFCLSGSNKAQSHFFHIFQQKHSSPERWRSDIAPGNVHTARSSFADRGASNWTPDNLNAAELQMYRSATNLECGGALRVQGTWSDSETNERPSWISPMSRQPTHERNGPAC
jgi:hypothetical protein